MSKDQGERRWMVYRVPDDAVLDLFHVPGEKWPHVLRIPVATNIPPGAKVLRVWQEFDQCAFSFLVEHESFDLVPPHERIPVAGWLQAETAVLQPMGDQEGCRQFGLLNHLEKENAQLRAIFNDLRKDSPPVDAAYERGRADARKECVEAVRGVYAEVVEEKNMEETFAVERVLDRLRSMMEAA